MDISFILVEPDAPGNIGASARALKTMGFSNLRLVNPACDPFERRAQYMAHASEDVLRGAVVYEDFASATSDLDYLVGTSPAPRRIRKSYYEAPQVAEMIVEVSPEKVGIVFGREGTGLTNAELECCDILASIPMACEHPTLNLSQSVMLFAYLLNQNRLWSQDRGRKATNPYASLKRKVQNLLDDLEIDSESRSYTRILDRLAAVSSQDQNLLHFLCDRLRSEIKPADDVQDLKPQQTPPVHSSL